MVDRPEGPTLTKTYSREKKRSVPGFTGKREEEKQEACRKKGQATVERAGAGGQERKKELKNRQYRYSRYHLLFSACLHPFNKSDQ